jgi:hypothetical protein
MPGTERKGDGDGEQSLPPLGDPREERLARAFAACLGRIQAGKPMDPEEVAAAYPDMADDLLELLEAVSDLDIVLEGEGQEQTDDP